MRTCLRLLILYRPDNCSAEARAAAGAVEAERAAKMEALAMQRGAAEQLAAAEKALAAERNTVRQVRMITFMRRYRSDSLLNGMWCLYTLVCSPCLSRSQDLQSPTRCLPVSLLEPHTTPHTHTHTHTYTLQLNEEVEAMQEAMSRGGAGITDAMKVGMCFWGGGGGRGQGCDL